MEEPFQCVEWSGGERYCATAKSVSEWTLVGSGVGRLTLEESDSGLVASRGAGLDLLLLPTSAEDRHHAELRGTCRGSVLRQSQRRGLGFGIRVPSKVADGASAAGHTRLRPLRATLRSTARGST